LPVAIYEKLLINRTEELQLDNLQLSVPDILQSLISALPDTLQPLVETLPDTL
jgi:hypothetical protein